MYICLVSENSLILHFCKCQEMMIKYGSLFTGIEGFDLGFNIAGMKCEWQVEIDKHCQAVLRYNSPNTEKFLDVQKAGKENLGSVDLVCGGFPCQDLSVAGKRKGMAGKRSGLWYEFARIIAELKPPWVVIENVPGLLSSNGGEDFAVILRWLGECGYYASWRILDSQYWGVAQRRRRLFIVGSLGNTGCGEILFESEGMPWNPAKGKKKRAGITQAITGRLGGGGPDDNKAQGGFIIPDKSTAITGHFAKGTDSDMTQTHIVAATETGAGFWTEGKPRLRCSTAPGQPQTILAFDTTQITSNGNYSEPKEGDPCHPLAGTAHAPAIAFTERTRKEGRNFESQDELAYSLTNPGAGGRSHSRQIAGKFGVRRLTPRECERLQGFPDDWTRYGIDENGKKIEISDTQRYKMAGNAVTRNVAEWIGKRIVKVHGRH